MSMTCKHKQILVLLIILWPVCVQNLNEYVVPLLGWVTMRGIKESISIISRAEKMRYIFIIAFTILFILFFIGLTLNFSGVQAEVFFGKAQNYMADYYNVAKASSGLDPYLFGTGVTSSERAYFPLTYLLFEPLSRFADYANSSASEAGLSNMGLASSSFYMMVTTLPFFLLLYDAFAIRNKRLRSWIIGCIALSGVMIFSYERGTTMILAAMLSTFFLLNYNNPNRVTKEFSFIALAIAAALKGIPAVLGILLIYDKRWPEALRLIVYGVFFILFPFLLIKGGFHNIPQFLLNLKANTTEYAVIPYRGLNYRFWLKELHLLSKTVIGALWRAGWSVLHYALFTIALFSAFFQPIRWKKLTLLMFAVATFSKNNGAYWALFLFVGMVLFLSEEDQPRINYLYLLGFILILNPFQVMHAGGLNWTSAIRNLSCLACYIALAIDSSMCMIRTCREQKRIQMDIPAGGSCSR